MNSKLKFQTATEDLTQANDNLANAQADITSKQSALDTLQSQYDDALAQIAFTEAERNEFQTSSK